MPAIITLEPAHGLVILTASLLAFEILLLGFLVVGRARSRAFPHEFLISNFGADHKQATGLDIGKGGYPDMGNGRYSEKLSYKDWLYLNRAQRVHYNFLEQVTPILAFVIFGGLEFPVWASVFGLIYFVGRLLYVFYLSDKGASHPGRVAGALLVDLGMLGGFVVVVLSAVTIFTH